MKLLTFRVDLSDFLYDLEAVFLWHLKVEEHYRNWLPLVKVLLIKDGSHSVDSLLTIGAERCSGQQVKLAQLVL